MQDASRGGLERVLNNTNLCPGGELIELKSQKNVYSSSQWVMRA